MCVIGPAMLFGTGIPRYAQKKSYTLSLTEYALKIPNNALWDTLYEALLI